MNGDDVKMILFFGTAACKLIGKVPRKAECYWVGGQVRAGKLEDILLTKWS